MDIQRNQAGEVGEAPMKAIEKTMLETYSQYFVPAQDALGSGEPFARFEIYSVIDYTIPATLSTGSSVQSAHAHAVLESNR